jgi:ketosteroid isomerase-like protein
MTTSLSELADLVRAALTEGDIDSYQHLLAPDAHWAAAEEPEWGCHNRNQILAWYKAARDEGMRAVVNEVVPGADSLLVGVTVRGRGATDEAGESVSRWQVMTVSDGHITNVWGFDNRAEAAERAGVPG